MLTKGFNDGIAIVKIHNKYGIIDKTGRDIITPYKYDYINEYVNGLASVKLNGKMGFINKEGKEVIPFKYNEVIYFNGEFALVQYTEEFNLVIINKTIERSGYIDNNGTEYWQDYW